jgi:periplasmic protein TonB
MSYLALLFCQDEKTARTITQVLNELEFQVEPCSEAFAAVKKLTTQAFEAVVVDCQSEENASLLLKTARNSVSNATSLMVALVEGQAGVAAAFRIGANLVLTKPIAIEQARGTLRVARGLLRKNAGPAAGASSSVASQPAVSVPTPAPVSAPVRPAASVPPSIPAVTATPAPPPITPTPSRLPAAAATAPAPIRPIPPSIPSSIPSAVSSQTASSQSLAPQRTPVPPSALRAVAASGSLETEAEHQPSPDAASAGLLEAMEFKTFEAAPERSFGLSASESVSVVEVNTGAHEAVRSALSPKAPISSQEFGGFGAAVAPARELPKAAPAIPKEVADLFETPVFGQSSAAPAVAPVHHFESAPQVAEQEADLDFSGAPAASRSRAPLMAIVVLLVLVGTAYYGWTQLHKPLASTTPTAGPLQPPPPDFGSAETTPAAPASSQATTASAPVADTPVENVNRFSRQKGAASQGNNQIAPDQVTTPIGIAPSRGASAPSSSPGGSVARTPLQVKTEPQRVPASQPAAAPEMAEAPSIANLGASAKPDALNTIAHSATAIPAAPSAQRISQGVSDGLLIKRVQPIYPQQAAQMHTQGKVALQATIAKDGSVRNVKVVSGPAILARAATDAVRQWKYKPYMLNGEPIEVQTDININFVPPQ